MHEALFWQRVAHVPLSKRQLKALNKILDGFRQPVTNRNWAALTRTSSDTALRTLAQELTDKLRKSATINWQNRKSARARMVAMVKVLLAKHKYPPDKQLHATGKAIAQAELLADTWAFDHG